MTQKTRSRHAITIALFSIAMFCKVCSLIALCAHYHVTLEHPHLEEKILTLHSVKNAKKKTA